MIAVEVLWHLDGNRGSESHQFQIIVSTFESLKVCHCRCTIADLKNDYLFVIGHQNSRRWKLGWQLDSSENFNITTFWSSVTKIYLIWCAASTKSYKKIKKAVTVFRFWKLHDIIVTFLCFVAPFRPILLTGQKLKKND